MKIGGFLTFVGSSVICTIIIIYIVASISFDMKCTQYLKRAGDANTVELASLNLETAKSYLEIRNLTNGIVSIFLRQPENDIEFWYSNISACQNELVNVSPDATQLERSNLLMKLRETLIDSGERGDVITCPEGISVYPYNALLFLLFWIGFIVAVTGVIKMAIDV